jgi:hypothetical protein
MAVGPFDPWRDGRNRCILAVSAHCLREAWVVRNRGTSGQPYHEQDRHCESRAAVSSGGWGIGVDRPFQLCRPQSSAFPMTGEHPSAPPNTF